MYQNQLRQILEMGIMSPEDLQPNELAMLMGEQTPQPNYDIPRMAMNTMRTESGPDAGNVVDMNFRQQPPQGYAPQQGQRQRMRVMGYGQGQVSDLGETEGPAPQLDVGRPGLEIAGLGKGQYGKDGNLYVRNPDGGLTQVRLGYDRDASWETMRRNLEKRKVEQGLEKGQADIDHTNEVTAGLRAQNAMKEDPFTQAALEKRYGKAEKGKQWTPDGRLVPIQGSEADQSSQSEIVGAENTLRKIDEMVGHKGMEDAVGMKGWGGLTMALGMSPLPGSDAADFKARLDEIKGGAFLQAFESLKGGGAITEVEGKKATDAITRMSTSQSEAEFKKAAAEFRSVVEQGLNRAKAARGIQSPTANPNAASVLEQAKAAIARGAPRDKVIQRLRASGIDPAGL